MNKDFPLHWRPVKYLHTGKHDYDDGMIVGNNPTKKRTMRQFKKHKKQLMDKYFNENQTESE